MKLAAALMLTSLGAIAQYSVERSGDVVRLEDVRNQISVSVATTIGNTAFEMKVKGHNVLRFPFASLAEFRAKPTLSGIPFLGPWANRLDEPAFYANGKKYAFNLELGNVRGPRPIHGFLLYTDQWKVVEAKADASAAWVTSRLEFYRHPEWMAQFPFAHTIDVTYRLANGALEVMARVENLSAEPMPISIGFHPYFQLTDSTRDDWTIGVGARLEWLLNPDKIPTGATRPIEDFLGAPQAALLKNFNLDHVFGDLVRDSAGRAVMYVKGKSQRLDVIYGPKYKAAVIFSPKAPSNFICFEPMAAITDAMNLAHRGVYQELQSLPAGEAWQESFWIRPSGF